MGRLAVNGLCNVEDFDDPELSGLVRELQPAVPAQSRRDRRAWEAAMTVIGLRRGGALHDDAELLCLNPGRGPLPFWLTNHVRRVFAADLYLGLVPGDPLSSPAMLADPGSLWPARWRQGRLVAQHMSVLDLAYEDEAFDGVCAAGALCSLPALEQISRAMDEACRVLRPGGIASVTIDYSLGGEEARQATPTIVFERDMVEEVLIGDRPWRLLTSLDETLSPATAAELVDLGAPRLSMSRPNPDEAARSATDVLVRLHGQLITSMHVALIRQPERPPTRRRPIRTGSAPHPLLELAKHLPTPLVVVHTGTWPDRRAPWSALGEHAVLTDLDGSDQTQADVLELDVVESELQRLLGSGVTTRAEALALRVGFDASAEGPPTLGLAQQLLGGIGLTLWRLSDLKTAGALSTYGWLGAWPHPGGPSSGRLNTAVARFVRDAASAGTSWEQQLRRAVIFGTLGFADLTRDALQTLLQHAPPSAAAAVAVDCLAPLS